MKKRIYFLSALLLFLLLLVILLRCFSVPELSNKSSPHPPSPDTSLFAKLPESVLDIFVYQTIQKLLIDSYQSFIINMKRFDTVLNAEEKKALNTYAKLTGISVNDDNKQFDFLPDYTIESLNLLLTDIRRLDQKINDIKIRLNTQHICSKMMIKPIENNDIVST